MSWVRADARAIAAVHSVSYYVLWVLSAAMSALAPFAHGDAVPVAELGRAWSAPVALVAASGLSLLLFAQAFVRLRRRGRSDHAPWSRAALFGGAVALGTLALVSPLDAVGEKYLLSGHMLQHVLIGDAAPALAVTALRGPLVFFLVPRIPLRALAQLAPLRTVLGLLVRPRVAFALWALVIAAWHVPTAYDYTLTHRVVHDLEHASFALVGVLVWAQLVDPARRRVLTAGGRLAFLALLFGAGQALANVLIFAFSPLYGPYAVQDERLLGLSPLLDQRLAGLVMMVEQVVALGICAAVLFRVYGRERAARERGALRLAAEP